MGDGEGTTPPTDILTVATCAVIGGAGSRDNIVEFGEVEETFSRRLLPLTHGIPSADTFARVFAKHNPNLFVQAVGRWMAAAYQGNRLVSMPIDGKALSASCPHRDGRRFPLRCPVSV